MPGLLAAGAQVTLYQLGIHGALGDAGPGLHAARNLVRDHHATPEVRVLEAALSR
jgi:hypothetical protein